MTRRTLVGVALSCALGPSGVVHGMINRTDPPGYGNMLRLSFNVGSGEYEFRLPY